MATKRKLVAKKVVVDSTDANEKVQVEQKRKESLVDENDGMDCEMLASASKSSQSTRSKRGKTQMHCLATERVQGIKKDVQFNDLGQPFGHAATQMQSYIGVLAREKVSITYDSWKKVPTDVKDMIWDSVNLSFNVHQNWKRGCLSSANDKWRQFKTFLTNYVYDRIDGPELHTPPDDYPGITPSDWSAFVISRLFEKFKKLSEKQKYRRAQYMHPYRLSRKGYAKFVNENPTLLGDDPEANQATLWMEGRKNKAGKYEGDELQGVATKIGEYISKKKAGTLNMQEKKGTILEDVLDVPEHNGRLRGFGGHVTKTLFYKCAIGKRPYSELSHEQQQKFLEQEARIARLEVIVYKSGARDVYIEEKGSCSVHCLNDNDDVVKLEDDDVNIVDSNSLDQGKHVALSLESGTNVGYGIIVRRLDEPQNCMCVSIDQIVDENALLPIPTSDYKSIGDAVGSHVTFFLVST